MRVFKTELDVASVVSLIKNAKEFVVIVSPFNDLTSYDELKSMINEAAKGIKIEYYVRKGEGMRGIEGINVKLFEVPLLHAKMFFSEHEAIISSGNLHSRPDINCTFLLNKQEEYNDLVDFFERYVKPTAVEVAVLSE